MSCVLVLLYVFVPMALTLYGGWHREDKDSAESGANRVWLPAEAEKQGLRYA